MYCTSFPEIQTMQTLIGCSLLITLQTAAVVWRSLPPCRTRAEASEAARDASAASLRAAPVWRSLREGWRHEIVGIVDEDELVRHPGQTQHPLDEAGAAHHGEVVAVAACVLVLLDELVQPDHVHERQAPQVQHDVTDARGLRIQALDHLGDLR